MKKILSSTLLLSAVPLAAMAQAEKPNVIFVLVDDLGYTDIEPYGQEKIQTPNLSQMAENGMQFMQFYSGSTVSAPSRASLMTGMHTGHTKIRGNKEIQPEGQEPVGDMLTLGDLFQTAGYATGIFGKWGLGYPGSGSEPTKKGFDEFYGYNCQRQAHRFFPQWLWENDSKIMLNGEGYSQDLIHQKALSFIQRNADKPFFAYVTYTLPHAALEQPKDTIWAMYRDKFPETPYDGKRGYTPVDKPRAEFAAMVTRLDVYIGELRAELERLGIAENTLLIFTSDNGPHIEGGADPAFFANELTPRGTKRALYEGGILVPTLMEWKGTIKADEKSELAAAFWDFMPTFAQLTGQEKSWKQPTDGISILPTITGKGKQKKHDYLYWEFHEEGGRQAIRQGDWKLIIQKINTGNPTYELYNLKSDPFEKTDLAAKYPKRVKKMTKKISKVRTQSDLFNFGIK
ncbi:MAG TPA: arylsulfatase [Bacteroidales bacterium]|nr:arylsulfatase [Bacteroidales bacterium]